jgi:hypothetical protein
VGKPFSLITLFYFLYLSLFNLYVISSSSRLLDAIKSAIKANIRVIKPVVRRTAESIRDWILPSPNSLNKKYTYLKPIITPEKKISEPR